LITLRRPLLIRAPHLEIELTGMDVNAINKENALIIRSCEKAATDLKRAWGRGDPKGRKQV